MTTPPFEIGDVVVNRAPFDRYVMRVTHVSWVEGFGIDGGWLIRGVHLSGGVKESGHPGQFTLATEEDIARYQRRLMAPVPMDAADRMRARIDTMSERQIRQAEHVLASPDPAREIVNIANVLRAAE